MALYCRCCPIFEQFINRLNLFIDLIHTRSFSSIFSISAEERGSVTSCLYAQRDLLCLGKTSQLHSAHLHTLLSLQGDSTESICSASFSHPGEPGGAPTSHRVEKSYVSPIQGHKPIHYSAEHTVCAARVVRWPPLHMGLTGDTLISLLTHTLCY